MAESSKTSGALNRAPLYCIDGFRENVSLSILYNDRAVYSQFVQFCLRVSDLFIAVFPEVSNLLGYFLYPTDKGTNKSTVNFTIDERQAGIKITSI